MPDGIYTYELRVSPNISAETKAALKLLAKKATSLKSARDLHRKGSLPQSLVQSGSFMISGGSVILPGASEDGAKQARATSEHQHRLKLSRQAVSITKFNDTTHALWCLTK